MVNSYPAGVLNKHCLLTLFFIFSETTWVISANRYVKYPQEWGTKDFINGRLHDQDGFFSDCS